MKLFRPNITDIENNLIPVASGTLHIGTTELAFGEGNFDNLQVNATPSGGFDVANKDYVDSQSHASPGGSDTYVQFNDGGDFGGDAGLTYNKTTDKLTINGSTYDATLGGSSEAGSFTDGTRSVTIADGTHGVDATLGNYTASLADNGNSAAAHFNYNNQRFAQFGTSTYGGNFSDTVRTLTACNGTYAVTGSSAAGTVAYFTNGSNIHLDLVSAAGGYALACTEGSFNVDLCDGSYGGHIYSGGYYARLLSTGGYAAEFSDGTRIALMCNGATAGTFYDGTRQVQLADGTYAIDVTNGVSRFAGNLIPSASGTIDVGTATLPFAEVRADDIYANDLYLAGESLHLGNRNLADASGALNVDSNTNIGGDVFITDTVGVGAGVTSREGDYVYPKVLVSRDFGDNNANYTYGLYAGGFVTATQNQGDWYAGLAASVECPTTNDNDMSNNYWTGIEADARHRGDGDIYGVYGGYIGSQTHRTTIASRVTGEIEGAYIYTGSVDGITTMSRGLLVAGGASSVDSNSYTVDVVGVQSQLSNISLFTASLNIDNVYGFRTTGSMQEYSSGPVAVTNWYGAYLSDITIAGGTPTTTNQYGLYVEEPTQGSNNYSIYTNGGEHLFGGNVLVHGTVEASGNLMPEASGTRDIGSVAVAWDDAHIDKIYLEDIVPTDPLQATTKQYVDSQLGTAGYWDRTGTKLTPKNANDNMEVNTTGDVGFGDIDGAANGTYLYIDDGQQKVEMGDADGNANGTMIIVRDDIQTVGLGDYADITNGTKILINDSTQVISVSKNFAPTASGTIDLGTVALAYDDAYIDKVHLEADPILPLQAATKQYVDAQIAGEDLWNRSGSTLEPTNANDNIDIGTGIVNAASGVLTGQLFVGGDGVQHTGDTAFTTYNIATIDNQNAGLKHVYTTGGGAQKQTRLYVNGVTAMYAISYDATPSEANVVVGNGQLWVSDEILAQGGLYGETTSGANLTIGSTSHATKGTVFIESPLEVNQQADSAGWTVNGYDDMSSVNLNGYIDGSANAWVKSNSALVLDANSAANNIFLEGDVVSINQLNGTNNQFRIYGVTDAGRRYVQFDTQSADDLFHIGPQDANILGMSVDGFAQVEFNQNVVVQGNITASGNIVADASGTRNIGSAAVRFAEVHADDVYCDSIHTSSATVNVGTSSITETGGDLTFTDPNSGPTTLAAITASGSKWSDEGDYLKPVTDGDTFRAYDSGGSQYLDISHTSGASIIQWNADDLTLKRNNGATTLNVESTGINNTGLKLGTANNPGYVMGIYNYNTSAFITLGSACTEFTINESGRDCDIRFEGDSNTHQLFLDASNGRSGFTNGTYVAGSLDGTLDIIQAGTSENSYLSIANYNNSTHQSAIQFRKSRSATMNGHSTTQDGDYLGILYFYGSGGSSWSTGTQILVQQDGANSTYCPSKITFNTTSGSGFNTNHMVLNAAGDVAVGQADATSKLDVNGDIEVGDADAFYMGDPTSDGTWRFVRSGNDLVIQRRETSTWVTKSTVTA